MVSVLDVCVSVKRGFVCECVFDAAPAATRSAPRAPRGRIRRCGGARPETQERAGLVMCAGLAAYATPSMWPRGGHGGGMVGMEGARYGLDMRRCKTRCRTLAVNTATRRHGRVQGGVGRALCAAGCVWQEFACCAFARSSDYVWNAGEAAQGRYILTWGHEAPLSPPASCILDKAPEHGRVVG